jgi:MOSC domain
MQTVSPELEAATAAVAAAPRDLGRVHAIIRRPREDEREALTDVRLDPAFGVDGDYWLDEARQMAGDDPIDPATQVTIMNIRVLQAIEPNESRWSLAGDQLYVDFDLSIEHLPAGSRLSIGDAVVEVSAIPHTGCAKFSARFGSDALRWINSPTGRAHRMRGLNARVIQAGTVSVGDAVSPA